MQLPLCQIPDKPCVDRPECKLPSGCHITCTLYIVKDPSDLCCRKIRINYQACLFLEHTGVTIIFQLVAITGSPSVLPYYSIMDRLSGLPVPDHSCFTLVCDTDCRNIFTVNTGFCYCLHSNSDLGRPYLSGIVFYHSGTGEELCEFLLCNGYRKSVMIKYYCPRTCCTLIKGKNEFFHWYVFYK